MRPIVHASRQRLGVVVAALVLVTSLGMAPPAAAATTRPATAKRVADAFDASVPASWRAAIPHRLVLIQGTSSRATTDGRILVGSYHATGSLRHLQTVLAHEFGHLLAYRYGRHTFLGAPPVGFAYRGPRPAEMWADCVATSFTGIVGPSHHLPPCGPADLAFTRAWLARGPARRSYSSSSR